MAAGEKMKTERGRGYPKQAVASELMASSKTCEERRCKTCRPNLSDDRRDHKEACDRPCATPFRADRRANQRIAASKIKASKLTNKIIIDGKKKLTINGERGWNKRIVDRFDLTLECIRRYYLDIESPLKETLERYKSFFLLFEDFRHYVEFFFLQDL